MIFSEKICGRKVAPKPPTNIAAGNNNIALMTPKSMNNYLTAIKIPAKNTVIMAEINITNMANIKNGKPNIIMALRSVGLFFNR